MLSKILTVFLIFAFVGQVSASPEKNALKNLFDEYNYSLTVEWDQKDKEFYRRETSLLIERIKELQNQGLTNSELINQAVLSINDEKVSNEIKSLIGLLDSNKLSFEETTSLIKKAMNNSQQSGASWNEDTAAKIWVSFLIVAISTAIILTIINSDGSDEPDDSSDDWPFDCNLIYDGQCMEGDPYYHW